MTPDQLLALVREGLLLVLLLSAPPVLAVMFVGFVSSFLQATTQIQDATLSFVPKLLAAVVALGLAGPWIGAQLLRFTTLLFEGIAMVQG